MNIGILPNNVLSWLLILFKLMPISHLIMPHITTFVTWFPNAGANHHVTLDLVSMTSSEPYLGNDHLHVGDGKSLVISNIAHSKIHSPKCMFTLSNILHVPNIKKF